MRRSVPSAVPRASTPSPLPDGAAGALKIDDGAMRARTSVTVALLQTLGAPLINDLAETPLLGGDTPVGSIHPTPLLR